MKSIFKKVISFILRFESELVLRKYKPKIVAITGSVGKTSTKDAVFSMLSKFAYVRKSDKSYNSEIGLPLTILGLENGWQNPLVWFKNIVKGFLLFAFPHKYPEWLVLEVGVGKPGDMRRTASWLSTDAVIMTTIGETPVHIEFFNSRKHLVEEKAELIKTLKKGGLLVLNADDETILEMREKTKNRIVTYGFSEEALLRASGASINYSPEGVPEGMLLRVDEGSRSIPVSVDGVFGTNHIYAVLATLAFALGEKLNLLEAVEALRNLDVPPGRMRLLKGMNDTLILDDSYNSSPHACHSALRTLGEVKIKGRKIAVLGDMLELGRHTDEAHFKVGQDVPKYADLLIVVGLRAKGIARGAIDQGMGKRKILELQNSSEAGEYLKANLKPGDLIFIKGSQGMRMERAVKIILAEEMDKRKLLVRQEGEWLNKE